MILNLSDSRAAVASRKYALLHPEEVAAAKLKYLRTHKEHMKMLLKKWIEDNYEYYQQYQRISQKIYRAHKDGDTELEAKLRVERKLLQASLADRKTLGRIVK